MRAFRHWVNGRWPSTAIVLAIGVLCGAGAVDAYRYQRALGGPTTTVVATVTRIEHHRNDTVVDVRYPTPDGRAIDVALPDTAQRHAVGDALTIRCPVRDPGSCIDAALRPDPYDVGIPAALAGLCAVLALLTATGVIDWRRVGDHG